MRPSRAALVLALALAAAPARAEPVVVDRLVAIVGPTPILLSELRARAVPALHASALQKLTGAARAEAERTVYRETLDRLVDEVLLGRAAAEARVRVTPAEIDDALQQVAIQNRTTIAEILSEASRIGFPEAAYRAALAAEVLEGKMLRLHLARTRPKLTGLNDRERDQLVLNERLAMFEALRRATPIEIRVLPQ